MHEILQGKEPLCFKTDASHAGLCTGLLEAMNGIYLPLKEEPDNTVFHLIALQA